MLFVEELLMTVLVILNATLPGQNLPIEVQTRLVGEEPAVAEAVPPTTAVDATLIGTVATLGAGLFATYQQGKKKHSENEERANANADTQLNQVRSLKATDVGVADIANNLAVALQKLSDANPQNAQALESCKEVAKKNAEGWNKDLKQYYANEPLPTDKDVGLDKVRTKLAEVNKMTTPTPDEESANVAS